MTKFVIEVSRDLFKGGRTAPPGTPPGGSKEGSSRDWPSEEAFSTLLLALISTVLTLTTSGIEVRVFVRKARDSAQSSFEPWLKLWAPDQVDGRACCSCGGVGQPTAPVHVASAVESGVGLADSDAADSGTDTVPAPPATVRTPAVDQPRPSKRSSPAENGANTEPSIGAGLGDVNCPNSPPVSASVAPAVGDTVSEETLRKSRYEGLGFLFVGDEGPNGVAVNDNTVVLNGDSVRQAMTQLSGCRDSSLSLDPSSKKFPRIPSIVKRPHVKRFVSVYLHSIRQEANVGKRGDGKHTRYSPAGMPAFLVVNIKGEEQRIPRDVLLIERPSWMKPINLTFLCAYQLQKACHLFTHVLSVLRMWPLAMPAPASRSQSTPRTAQPAAAESDICILRDSAHPGRETTGSIPQHGAKFIPRYVIGDAAVVVGEATYEKSYDRRIGLVRNLSLRETVSQIESELPSWFMSKATIYE